MGFSVFSRFFMFCYTVGQNSIAANGAARMHAGKDHRMMMPLGQGQVGGEAHSRQHRMLGGMPFQLQPPMTQPPPPVQDFYNFPAGSVEATEIVLRNRSRMTAREASGMYLYLFFSSPRAVSSMFSL